MGWRLPLTVVAFVAATGCSEGDVTRQRPGDGDAKRLGGLLGLTAVLHTWKRDLHFHPHLHCIVTGAALGAAADGRPKWIDAGRDSLFPVKELERPLIPRGKFVAGPERSHARGEPTLPEALQAPGAFSAVLGKVSFVERGG